MRPGPRAGLDQRQPVPGVRADRRHDHARRGGERGQRRRVGGVGLDQRPVPRRRRQGRPHRRAASPATARPGRSGSPAARARPGARPSAPRRTRSRRRRRGRARVRHAPSSPGRSSPAAPCSERGVRCIQRTQRRVRSDRPARGQTLRRYWPPTSKNAAVSCPSEHTRAARISSSNTLPPPVATSCSRRRAAAAAPAWRRLEVGEPVELAALLLLGGPGELDLDRRSGAASREERVHPDDRQRAVVLAVLVEHRLVLDPPALVAGLHRAEHAAALGDAGRTRPARPPRRGRSARRRRTSPAAGSRSATAPTPCR